MNEVDYTRPCRALKYILIGLGAWSHQQLTSCKLIAHHFLNVTEMFLFEDQVFVSCYITEYLAHKIPAVVIISLLRTGFNVD